MTDDRAVLEAAEDLYGRTPGEFTAARDGRAAAARKEGDPGLARTVKAWRRPSVAAWAVNVLVRRRPEEMRRLAELGEALRRAQAELSGEDLRTLGGRRHQVVYWLAREAAGLAAGEGHELSDAGFAQVQATLDAALADAQAAAAVTSGRLVRALENTGMSSVDLTDAVAGPLSDAGPGSSAPAGGPDRRLQAEIREAEEAVAAEEEAVTVAEAEVTRRRAELQEAEKRRRGAEDRGIEAEAALSTARREVEEASGDEDRASEAEGAARRGLDLARRRLDRARAHVAQLPPGVGATDGG